MKWKLNGEWVSEWLVVGEKKMCVGIYCMDMCLFLLKAINRKLLVIRIIHSLLLSLLPLYDYIYDNEIIKINQNVSPSSYRNNVQCDTFEYS